MLFVLHLYFFVSDLTPCSYLLVFVLHVWAISTPCPYFLLLVVPLYPSECPCLLVFVLPSCSCRSDLTLTSLFLSCDTRSSSLSNRERWTAVECYGSRAFSRIMSDPPILVVGGVRQRGWKMYGTRCCALRVAVRWSTDGCIVSASEVPLAQITNGLILFFCRLWNITVSYNKTNGIKKHVIYRQALDNNIIAVIKSTAVKCYVASSLSCFQGRSDSLPLPLSSLALMMPRSILQEYF